MSAVHVVESPDHFKSLLSEDLTRVSLINFWAGFASPCVEMNDVVEELSKKYPQLLVLNVEAEEQEDIAKSFDIESVPTFLILQGHKLLKRIDGADAQTLTASVAKLAKPTPPVNPLSSTQQLPAAPADGAEEKQKLNARLEALMRQDEVMLFIKGTPDVPRCGFSRKIVNLLKDQGVKFSSFDILSDESVRQGLKVYNDWPTFPQLIVKGEFVGGLDVVQEMVENGELKELLT
ncbi:glutaredoxin [Thelephora terrestris]|uniref:Glutaredoxin n=1 Tax=Thelephora terrestris TaxID=56493 RepID=A0A9P6LAN9_9AGAM|nr:glutaredoxin [Thelephora terrestris]